MPPVAEQMNLIDVLPENVKKIRALIRKRDEHHEYHLDHNKKAKEYEEKIWQAVQDSGGKLGADGKLTLKLSEDEVLEVKQAPAKLTCTVKSPKRKGEEEEVVDDEEGGDEEDGEKPEAPARRARNG